MADAKIPGQFNSRYWLDKADKFIGEAAKAGFTDKQVIDELNRRMKEEWPAEQKANEKALRDMSISMGRKENPETAKNLDFMYGMSTTGRGALNLAGKVIGQENLGNKVFPEPPGINKQGINYNVGQFADPTAWIAGGKLFQGGAKVASKIPKLGKMAMTKAAGGGAVAGGGIGALNPDVDPLTGLSTGSSIGALLPMVPWAAKKTTGGLYSLGSGAKGTAQNWLHNTVPDRQQAISALRQVTPTNPGHQPTIAEAGTIAKPPIAELIAIENKARAGQSGVASKFLERDRTNAAARAQILENIAVQGRKPVKNLNGPKRVGGKPVTSLSPLELNRQRQTTPLYKQAENDLVPTFMLPGKAGIPPNQGTLTIAELQKVKEGLNSQISGLAEKKAKTGLLAEEATTLRELTNMTQRINKTMRSASPLYASAQDKYRRLSIPINQAVVADQLLTSLQSPAGVERATVFGNAWRNAPQTIMKSDRVPRYDQMTEVFNPQQMGLLSGVKEGVDREAQLVADRVSGGIVGKPGSFLSSVEEKVPGFLEKGITALRKALSKSGQTLDVEAQRIIDNLALDPNQMANFMEQLSPSEKAAVIQNMIDRGKGAFIGATVNTGQ